MKSCFLPFTNSSLTLHHFSVLFDFRILVSGLLSYQPMRRIPTLRLPNEGPKPLARTSMGE